MGIGGVFLCGCNNGSTSEKSDASFDASADVQTTDAEDLDAAMDASSDASDDADVGGCTPDASLEEPIPNCAPLPAPDTGNLKQDCVSRINQLRGQCQCLPPLARWTGGEACADQHAEYDSTHGAHAGTIAGICSPGGWAQNECPGWGSNSAVITNCLQMMWNEGPGEPYSEHGHYINMTNPSYTKVACGFYTTGSGTVWSVQNFSD